MENKAVSNVALDLEKAVLGSLLVDKGAYHRIESIVDAKAFYSGQNRVIFEAIQKLHNEAQPIDILTVKNRLDKEGNLAIAEGVTYLTEIIQGVASSANIEVHARIIQQKYIMREISKISGEIYYESLNPGTDVFDLLDKAEKNLFDLGQQNFRSNYEEMEPLFMKTLERLEAVKSKGSSITGIPSGFEKLDRLTAGFQKTDLVILAARPAMGKTALTLNIARNAASMGASVAFFSLEMGDTQLMQRILCSESEIDAQRMRTGMLQENEWSRIVKTGGKIVNYPLYIDDTPALSIYELRAKCRRLKAEKNIDLVIIDYLQLMTSKEGKNREQEIASISRNLKVIAKELDVCIIALSQLSRAVESRGGDKRPMLSDLRESGSIEQDADLVAFLYRPEYYGFETDETGESTVGLAEVIISKQRNGPTGSEKLSFEKKYGKFGPWESVYSPYTNSEIVLPTDLADN